MRGSKRALARERRSFEEVHRKIERECAIYWVWRTHLALRVTVPLYYAKSRSRCFGCPPRYQSWGCGFRREKWMGDLIIQTDKVFY